MSKTKRLFGAVGFIILLGLFVWIVHSPRVPIYNGKSLIQWLAVYVTVPENTDANQLARADDAVRRIGTNALPTLLHLMAAHDNPVKLKCLALLQRQRLIKIDYMDAYQRNLMGMDGLLVLKTEAKQAVPDLIKLYRHSDSCDFKINIIDVLVSIGPQAEATVPFLIHEATNDNWVVGMKAVEALGKLRSKPGLTVPALVELLYQTNCIGNFRDDAVQALEKFGPDATSAIPDLIRALTNSSSNVDINIRGDIVDALKAIDPVIGVKFETNVF